LVILTDEIDIADCSAVGANLVNKVLRCGVQVVSIKLVLYIFLWNFQGSGSD